MLDHPSPHPLPMRGEGEHLA
ncbi:hypothetical protein CBM2589_B240053 [Cupriavidus taiwanensis]|uniref:Uncharacterized protein n=1 Tax=Cupriavidus taiwanensis TaxID=164546 RepID=A0A976A1K0_9BURK|nr:hypothetical protein CBM2589_B240053 [Cupriavidus taiwanensis]